LTFWRFTNRIIIIIIMAGTLAPPGEYDLEIEHIELNGEFCLEAHKQSFL